MSNAQIKSIALTALRISGTVLLFAAKAIVYLCIAIAVVGQLLFAEYTQTAPAPIEESSPIADPWEEPIENASPVALDLPVVPVPAMAKTIARPAILAVDVSDAVKETIVLDVDARRYQDMTSPQLRKECSAIGIKWRSAHGTSKHLSKAEMLAALGA